MNALLKDNTRVEMVKDAGESHSGRERCTVGRARTPTLFGTYCLPDSPG